MYFSERQMRSALPAYNILSRADAPEPTNRRPCGATRPYGWYPSPRDRLGRQGQERTQPLRGNDPTKAGKHERALLGRTGTSIQSRSSNILRRVTQKSDMLLHLLRISSSTYARVLAYVLQCFQMERVACTVQLFETKCRFVVFR